MEQRSEEWFQQRLGKVTASRVADILATIRNGNWAAARKNYAAQLVAERLTGKVPESISNEAIQWGVDQEEPAREAYTKHTGTEVTESGFVDHPTIEHSGASPDGLIGDDGLIEIKCPTQATHIETLLNEEINPRYMLQMLWQMVCTGRDYCDFVSFDPRMPEDMQLFVERVHLDKEEADRVEREVVAFLAEVDATVNSLKNKFRHE